MLGSWELGPLDGYTGVKNITIDYRKVGGTKDLKDFPFLFNESGQTYLKTTGNGGSITDSNGYDIIFTDENNIQLDHEIGLYNGGASNGDLITWVRIPYLRHNKDTKIRIHYGNSGISSSQENINGVWDTNYKGVWHLNEDGTPSDTGFLDPSATGDDYTGFTNPTNAYSSNDSDATSASKNQNQDYYNFGITIPANNIVIGIQIDVEAATPDTGTDLEVELSWDGGTSYTSKAQSHTVDGVDTYYTTGGASDLWGRDSWTTTELNNTNFRVKIEHTGTQDDLHIDHVRVKVFYQGYTILDSTLNNNDGMPIGVSKVSGQIGDCQSFDENDDYITIPVGSLETFTASTWIYPTHSNSYGSIFGNDDRYGIQVRGSDGDPHPYELDFYDGNDHYADSALTPSVWSHIVVTKTGSSVNFYINGDFEGNVTIDPGSLVFDKIGNNAIGEAFGGRLDEARISNIVRSADWFKTEYNNQNLPSTFYTVSDI